MTTRVYRATVNPSFATTVTRDVTSNFSQREKGNEAGLNGHGLVRTKSPRSNVKKGADLVQRPA